MASFFAGYITGAIAAILIGVSFGFATLESRDDCRAANPGYECAAAMAPSKPWGQP